MYTTDFIERIKPHVMADCLKKKIIPSIVIAQACLESNWGRSGLTKKYNNFFGVKGNAQNGVRFDTEEERNGKLVIEQHYFKKYTNLEEAISDHTDLFFRVKLGGKLRYQRVIDSKNFVDGARALESCGYATDSQYAEKIISICQKHKLGLVDGEYFELLRKKNVKAEKPVVKPLEVYKMYTVKRGDTLSKICNTSNVTILEEVAKLNNLKNIHTIFVGQRLKLPSKLVK